MITSGLLLSVDHFAKTAWYCRPTLKPVSLAHLSLPFTETRTRVAQNRDGEPRKGLQFANLALIDEGINLDGTRPQRSDVRPAAEVDRRILEQPAQGIPGRSP